MAGIMFSDTFKINALDYDPAAKKKEKKFDKGKLCTNQ